jgi:hypothetical protein
MTQFVKGGVEQFSYHKNGKHIVGKILTLAELKAIPAGYGGRIGVIPRCKVDDDVYHILCNIHWQHKGNEGDVIGDLGGGIKCNEKPYDTLYRELKEEVPGWHDILKSQIGHSPIEIYSIEYLHSSVKSLRYSITIFVDITPFIKVMNDLFIPTKEIKGINAYNDLIEALSINNINYGLQYYREYLMYKGIT